MEMAIAEEIVAFALRLKPEQCTLVPERRRKSPPRATDVWKHRERVSPGSGRPARAGIVVSAFIEPITRS